MATYVECIRADGRGFVALRAEHITSVNPVFNDNDEFTHSRVGLVNGGWIDVNEVWEQIAYAIEAPEFSAVTPTTEVIFG